MSAYRPTVGSERRWGVHPSQGARVNVRVVADRDAPCGQTIGIDPLATVGVPVWIDDRARMTHRRQ
jgi:hypothetical protein